MMTRVQILPPEDQDRRLESLAARRRESKGKLIRRGEPYTQLRVTRGYDACRRFLDALDSSARLERLCIGQDLERRAFTILDRYRDHDVSFVDATSCALMQAERIRHAFAFDSHFATAGFLRVPADAGLEQHRTSGT